MKLERRFHPEAVVSKDEWRPALCNAHLVEIKGKRYLLATDSYSGVLLPVESSPEDKLGAVSPLALQLARRYGARSLPIEIGCEDGLRVPLVGVLDRPDTEAGSMTKVISDYSAKKKYAFEIGLDTRILANLAKSLGGNGVKLSFESDPMKSFHVTPLQTGGIEDVRGVMMPIRLV